MRQELQWAYAQLTQPETQAPFIGTEGSVSHKLMVLSETLPYTVPDGYTLGIEAAGFACKVSVPSSYFIVTNCISISSHAPSLVLNRPLILPAGAVLNGCFINNSTWQQWMTMFIQGVLIPNVDSAPSSTV